MKDILSQGIDRIPNDILSTIVAKAVSLADGLVSHTSDTVVVPSKSNPRSPRVVNLFPSGKVECSNCPGFASFCICAHFLGACMSKDRLSNFLVSTKRISGGVHLPAEVTYDMPKGRGGKEERAPRRRNTTKKVTKVVHQSSLGANSNLNNNSQSLTVFPCSGAVFNIPLSLAGTSSLTQTIPYQM